MHNKCVTDGRHLGGGALCRHLCIYALHTTPHNKCVTDERHLGGAPSVYIYAFIHAFMHAFMHHTQQPHLRCRRDGHILLHHIPEVN
jgi:hypothetical protein